MANFLTSIFIIISLLKISSGSLLGGPAPIQLPDDELKAALNAVKGDFIQLAATQNIKINSNLKIFFKPRQAYQQVVAGKIYYAKVQVSTNKFAHIKIFRDLSNPPKYELSEALFNKKPSDSLLGSFSNICTQPKQTGPCRAAFVRYYYDESTKTCKDFVYGGCQGNSNNFRSVKQCQKTCVNTNGDSTKVVSNRNPVVTEPPNTTDICNLPKIHGTCKGHKYRYWFNEKTNKCQRFRYSGCGGNLNNFRSKKQCLSKCVKQ